MKNPNAAAAALTAFFVWILGRVVSHYGLVDVTPDRIAIAAGALTVTVLWIGKDGIRGALRRIWAGANVAVNGNRATKP